MIRTSCGRWVPASPVRGCSSTTVVSSRGRTDPINFSSHFEQAIAALTLAHARGHKRSVGYREKTRMCLKSYVTIARTSGYTCSSDVASTPFERPLAYAVFVNLS